MQNNLVIPPVPPEYQSEPYLKIDEAQLIGILKDPKSTVFQVNIACRRLALIGTRQAVPPLAALLSNPELAHYARYALKPIPDPSVDDALRAALPKLKGKLLVGVINTIGDRRDTKAVDALARLMYSPDLEVGTAAAASLGLISGAAAAKALQDGLGKARGPLRTEVAASCLVCAEGLIAQGDETRAFAFYDVLSRPGIPKTVRLAAMHATIDADTPLARRRRASQ
jgi:HEAT repeat protein